MEDFVHVQNVGQVPAKRASEVRPGDVLMYNFGYTYTVLSVTPKGKSVLIAERSDDSGREFMRRRLGSTMVAWVPGKSGSSHGSSSSPGHGRLTPSEMERDVDDVLKNLSAGADDEASGRLFVGVFPAGISYADRSRERHGDYLKLAFLPYRTLELEWAPGAPVPLVLREEISRHAASLQARRGEPFRVSTSGQTVTLGR